MSSIDIVTDYLMANYYDDIERLAHVKMVGALANKPDITPEYIAPLIDKIALFNGIKKSHQPTDVDITIAARQVVKGLNFIMYKQDEPDTSGEMNRNGD